MAEEATNTEVDPQVTFKVKTSSDGLHNITIAETATVLDLKKMLAGDAYGAYTEDPQFIRKYLELLLLLLFQSHIT